MTIKIYDYSASKIPLMLYLIDNVLDNVNLVKYKVLKRPKQVSKPVRV